jgi:hypothetical protein
VQKEVAFDLPVTVEFQAVPVLVPTTSVWLQLHRLIVHGDRDDG